MRTGAMAAALGICGVLLVGCAERPEAGPRAVAPLPRVFRFDGTNETVTADDVAGARGDRTVTADFNLDGLQDVAVVETNAQGESQITIYVRRPVTGSRGMTELVSFYRGGAIRTAGTGSVIGVMTRRRDQYSDLIILMSGTNGPNEMVHFYSDGKSFSLRDDGPTASP